MMACRFDDMLGVGQCPKCNVQQRPIRVGFVGVPGAGKTSTARGLASACRRIEGLKNVELSAEYARRYIAKYGPIQAAWEQYRILKKQLDWEEAVGSVDLILTDSPIFLSLMYAMALSNGTPKDVMVVNDLFSEMHKLNSPTPRYDIIFHLPPKVEPVKDGIRSEEQFDPTWRNKADKQLQAVFTIFTPRQFHTVEAVDREERIDECINVLQDYCAKRFADWEEVKDAS